MGVFQASPGGSPKHHSTKAFLHSTLQIHLKTNWSWPILKNKDEDMRSTTSHCNGNKKEWRCLCLDMFNVSICLAYAEVSWGFLSQLFQFFPLLQSARQVIQRCHRCRNRPASRLPIGTSQNLNSMAVQRPPPWRPLENKVSSNLKALSIFWPPTRQESCVFRERFSPGMCLKKRNA